MELRRLREDELGEVARLHRAAGALIPGYDPAAEPEAATLETYVRAFGRGEVWGAFGDGRLLGLIALEAGWIEHLYVEPARNGRGIGRRLVALAQARQAELRLVTYRANARARALYERMGFAAEAFGVDESSPPRTPNVTYLWRRPFEVRRLEAHETDAAAALHRRSMATIPGIDPDLHTPEQVRAFYATRVFARGPVWGAWEDGRLLGHLAASPGWVDHLYVEPNQWGRGVGAALVARVRVEQADLQLWTFQANARARAFYAGLGFREEEVTDGSGNEERLPDVRLRWRREWGA